MYVCIFYYKNLYDHLMKILYYDCFAGISGDMNLGALIDLGVESEYLTDELRKLKLDGYELRITEQQRKGITGTRVEVIIGEESPPRGHEHEHSHEPEHHVHRNLHDIENIVNGSSLSEKVKAMSLKIFRLIAEAEAKIHGKSVDEVHFHEVGAIDSIVDIVGAAICIDRLSPDRIISSPVEMGGGFVRCAHGTFPVPAPATLEILKGKPMKLGATSFEMTTPTGAAILAALTDEFTETLSFAPASTGYGIGSRDTEIPNVLRVCLGEVIGQNSQEKNTEAMMLRCNIDDMNPEIYPYVMEKLFDAGADDVFLQQVIMKKTRPAVVISVLCPHDKIADMEHILFTETSTLGIRYYPVTKAVLDRTSGSVSTPWGKVRIKKAYYQGKVVRMKPEYENCAAIARENRISLEKVYEYVRRKIADEVEE
jgi:uncharacterized protein (TIGR00299 family) protein